MPLNGMSSKGRNSEHSMTRRAPYIALLVVGLTLALVGCNATFQPSLFPLSSDETVVFEPALLGTWTPDDISTIVRGLNTEYTVDFNDISIIFEKGIDKDYAVTFRDYDDPVLGLVEVHLVQLGKRYFLDVYPGEIADSDQSALRYFPVFPVHLLIPMELNGDVLKLGWLSENWLQERLGSGEMDSLYTHVVDPFLDEEEIFLFTAHTEELQRFYLKHAGDDEAFEWEEFYRQK